MLRQRFVVVTMLFVTVLTGLALGQEKNEFSGTIGRISVSDQGVPGTNFFDNVVRSGNGLTFDLNYAHLWREIPIASLSVEIPVVVDLNQELNYGQNVIPESYRSVFVTPSFRANFLSEHAISPWLSGGGGLVRFFESDKLVFGGSNPGPSGTTKAVIQFGAGLDVRVARIWSVRGEVRDFYSGVPDLNVNTGKSWQHNFYVGGGVVYHF